MRVLAEAETEGNIVAAEAGELKSMLQTIEFKDNKEIEGNNNKQQQVEAEATPDCGYDYDYEFSVIDGDDDFICSEELGLGLELESEEDDEAEEKEEGDVNYNSAYNVMISEEENTDAHSEKLKKSYVRHKPSKIITTALPAAGSTAKDKKRCSGTVVQRIQAPPELVWSIVRRFDAPQLYKHFIRSCRMIDDAGGCRVGSIREVHVVSGLPANTSVERLDVLDDRRYVAGFSVIGGDHRLRNYRATTSLHRMQPVVGVDAKLSCALSGAVSGGCAGDGGEGRFEKGDTWTLVVESYGVDVPGGNTLEETATFVNTVIKCNLQSLAHLCERLASSNLNLN